ncbi:MAG TPA: HAD-IB family phosphatase [Candidatus Paceibacterota bacterium]
MQGDIKAVAFDIDGTLVRENFWHKLHQLFGLSDEDDFRWFELYHEKKLEYREWMDLISAEYRKNPQSKEAIEETFREYLFVQETKKLIKRLQGKYELALISSNIDAYVEDVGNRLSIPFRYAFSTIEYNTSGMFSRIAFTSEGTELEAKVEAIQDLCARLLLKPEQVVFVGDSRNDLDAFRYTGRGILLREGNEELRTAAWKRVSNLSELEAIL